MSESRPIFKISLTNPPIFGCSLGKLAFLAVVSDSNIARATIASNDTLVITRGDSVGTTTCMLTATDIDASRISLTFPVTNTSSVAVEEDFHLIPTAFVLRQNYPNPFNPQTSFEFQVPSSVFVTLKVYDVLGRDIATLVNEVKQPGVYKVTWDASQLLSGVYLYRMLAGSFVAAKKLVLLR